MTTQDHMARVRKLAEQARQWEAQDDTPEVCPIETKVCRCPTCGLTTQMVRGKLVSRGWSREDAQRVTTIPPTEAASYPYLASVRVDGVEVYRIGKDLAEATDPEVIHDIEAAMRRKS